MTNSSDDAYYDDEEELDQTISFDMNDIEAALLAPYDYEEDDSDFVVNVAEELGLIEPDEYVEPIYHHQVARPPQPVRNEQLAQIRSPAQVRKPQQTPPAVRKSQQPVVPTPKRTRKLENTVTRRPDLGAPRGNEFTAAGSHTQLNADQPTYRRKAVATAPKKEKKSSVHLLYAGVLISALIGFGLFYLNVYLPAIGKTFVLGIY